MIYIPKGKAKEYGDYALNLYKGCPHGCVYCFAPSVLRTDKKEFHESCEWREAAIKRIHGWFDRNPDVTGKHIHLCFTCDPFPTGDFDISLTYQVIELIHDSKNFVQILTKGEIPYEIMKILDPEDIVGVSISCGDELAKTIEPNALAPSLRLANLQETRQVVKEMFGEPCKTFVSCEPVFEAERIYSLIKNFHFIDEFKIGKLNYMSKDNPLYPNINWKEFGRECERLCIEHGRKYYIKESLREEMGK